VKNIRQVDGYMQLATQAGSTTTNWMADVPGYHRHVWFHPGGIANILSMVNMIVKYRVTYDSHEGKYPNQFCVHKADGGIRKFQQSRRGLYYLDTATTKNHTVLAITTVEANKSRYTERDYSRAQHTNTRWTARTHRFYSLPRRELYPQLPYPTARRQQRACNLWT
jgi:hypothetical protein